MKAYERVSRKDDWCRPKGQQGNKWRSKVNWLLAEEYFKIHDSDAVINEADDEVTEKLKRRALFAKHLTGAMDSAPAGEQE